jgi:cytochrome c1
MFGTTMTGVPVWARKAALAATAIGLLAPGLAIAQEAPIARQNWTFSGLTGTYDPAQLQRGYRIYKEVCSNCHSLRLIKYRNLTDPGGPGFTEGQVKTLIKDVSFDDAVDTNGNPTKRPAQLADVFKSPFANETAAKAANGGSAPPDLSLMARARLAASNTPLFLAPFQWLNEIAHGYQEGGADYIHAILTGFHDKAPAFAKDAKGKLTMIPEAQAAKESPRCASVAPGEVGDDGKLKEDECTPLTDGLYYNDAFPGHQIHMPPPLAADGQVQYTDGTPATVDQYAKDVSAFLMWTSDPTLEERKDVGLRMMIYLVILAGLLWLAKRQIWSRLH